MSHKLSSRLSPRAKRIVLRASRGQEVVALLQVAPTVERKTLEAEVQEQGGRVRSWLGPQGMISVEVPAERLSQIADLPGVVYVEAAEPYSA